MDEQLKRQRALVAFLADRLAQAITAIDKQWRNAFERADLEACQYWSDEKDKLVKMDSDTCEGLRQFTRETSDYQISIYTVRAMCEMHLEQLEKKADGDEPDTADQAGT